MEIEETYRFSGLSLEDFERAAPESDEVRLMEHILYEVKKVIVGQDNLLERVFVAMLCQGHQLVEGVLGRAKTFTIKTLAQKAQGTFKGIRFIPDLVLAGLVGTRINNQKRGDFSISLGPVFGKRLLANEIKRALAKVQKALLELMQERQATIGNDTLRFANLRRRRKAITSSGLASSPRSEPRGGEWLRPWGTR
jgi:MoxR-like ATPase